MDVDGIAANGNNDTVGVGDTFGAAFLVRALKSGDLQEATRFANAVAARRVASGKVQAVPASVGIDS
jgi:sugar/nucleoside kinase (ribokinase family)